MSPFYFSIKILYLKFEIAQYKIELTTIKLHKKTSVIISIQKLKK